MRTQYKEQAAEQAAELANATEASEGVKVTRLNSLLTQQAALQRQEDLSQLFPQRNAHTLAVNELPLKEFIQTVFTDLLKVNYVIADGANLNTTLTLNVPQAVTSRRLFTLSSQVLAERKLNIAHREGVFYIYQQDSDTRSAVIIGIGRRHSDVPDTTSQVLQVVPLRYGVKISLERTVRGLTSAQITADIEQNTLFVRGSRNEILRVLDLINLLDIPSTRGRYVGLLNLTYITPKEIMDKLPQLMQAEGIVASARAIEGPALLMVPIEQIGAVALFAGDEFVLERAEFWTKEIDKPSKGEDKRYYIYHPRYARAADLGNSVAPLIGDVATPFGAQGNQTRDTQSAARSDSSGSKTAGNGDIRMTVDDRSNSLIFYTKGEAYQSILPIIQRLDVLPKQILLDATIAEVTLSDEFAQGFEFAFRKGRLTGGNIGALGVSAMGGFRLDWTDGVSTILARLQASTGLINILSNPTIVVRDGVAASMTVGDDIPTVGSTTINPGTDTQSTTVVYRKTGVTLNVTPTINAQGLVVLQIDQRISNTSSSGPKLQGSPSIFERSIKTEVLAQSGQTVLLGGLISENSSQGQSHVPVLSRLPLLGNLFKGEEKSKKKTELVIFITPRVLDNLDQWDEIRNRITESLTNITVSD
uniref:General secretion pathway protein D n=1 Tax=Rheinheimera sp. BAL341 TaxID=1708203 RepID=A0A486XV64_9GAMM